jgi:hypothetical protein
MCKARTMTYLLVNVYKQSWEAMQSSWTIRHFSVERISMFQRKSLLPSTGTDGDG